MVSGSYDIALEEAHIEDFNVVTYTSVVPAEATEVTSTPSACCQHPIAARQSSTSCFGLPHIAGVWGSDALSRVSR